MDVVVCFFCFVMFDMIDLNIVLIQCFYMVFQQCDIDMMFVCYVDDIVFSDFVFGELCGEFVCDMWWMLVVWVQEFLLMFGEVVVDDQVGCVKWCVDYWFVVIGWRVVNWIDVCFWFCDGCIVEYCDYFDLWCWVCQVFGMKGVLFGWMFFMQCVICVQVWKNFDVYCVKWKQVMLCGCFVMVLLLC